MIELDLTDEEYVELRLAIRHYRGIVEGQQLETGYNPPRIDASQLQAVLNRLISIDDKLTK